MKTHEYRSASIIDTKTGYGLPHRANAIDDAVVDRKAHRVRSSSPGSYLLRMRNAVSAAMYALRKRRELKRSLPQLSTLSDRMLEDIGFTRGDIIAAENGLLDKAQLELQRTRNRENKRIQRRNVARVSAHRNERNAANDPDFCKTRYA